MQASLFQHYHIPSYLFTYSPHLIHSTTTTTGSQRSAKLQAFDSLFHQSASSSSTTTTNINTSIVAIFTDNRSRLSPGSTNFLQELLSYPSNEYHYPIFGFDSHSLLPTNIYEQWEAEWVHSTPNNNNSHNNDNNNDNNNNNNPWERRAQYFTQKIQQNIASLSLSSHHQNHIHPIHPLSLTQIEVQVWRETSQEQYIQETLYGTQRTIQVISDYYYY
jgi:hypothetical protein